MSSAPGAFARVLAPMRLRSRLAARLMFTTVHLTACVPRGGAPAPAAGGPPYESERLIVSDTTTSGNPSAGPAPSLHAAQHPGIGAYLRGVADALVAPDANTDAVLAVAAADGVERGSTQAYFHPPDQRLSRGILHVGRSGAHRLPPGSVTFYCDSARAPVTLAELVAAFGPWAREEAPTSPVARWPIVFTSRYRRGGPERPGEDVAVIVSASLLSDPSRSDARVADIDLQRGRATPR